MAKSAVERTREYRARRRVLIAAMPKVACGCGCGDLMAPVDTHGRVRTIMQGHQRGNEATLVKDGSFWRGRRHTPESRAKMSAALDQGSLTYSSLHKWIARHFERSGFCESCGETKPTEWANRDHSYASRDRSHWLELCVSCHQHHDIRHNGKRQGAAARR